jgi:ribosomal protein S18 acetylase RimI-like enzyme
MLMRRHSTGANDLERLIDLATTCRAVEAIDPWPPAYELRHHLAAVGSDRPADTQVWESPTGALAAFATIWDGATLLWYMHPQAQSDDLFEQIVGWGQARARELAHAACERAALYVPARADDRAVGALLERHGFVAEDWTILRMARALDQPIPAPEIPGGFRLRPLSSAQELAAADAIHQELFVAGPAIVRDRLALIGAAADVVALDLAATAADGTLAAFCLCTLSCAAHTGRERREGWVDLLGTRPAYRRRGLGRAILLSGLQRLKHHGADVALLGTTSWNAAAQRLFAAVGFRLLLEVRWYAWEQNG